MVCPANAITVSTGTSALTDCLCELGYKEPKGANFDECTWLVSARSAGPDGATALHLHLCIFPDHLALSLSPTRGSLRSDLGKTNESCEKLVRQNGPHPLDHDFHTPFCALLLTRARNPSIPVPLFASPFLHPLSPPTTRLIAPCHLQGAPTLARFHCRFNLH